MFAGVFSKIKTCCFSSKDLSSVSNFSPLIASVFPYAVCLNLFSVLKPSLERFSIRDELKGWFPWNFPLANFGKCAYKVAVIFSKGDLDLFFFGDYFNGFDPMGFITIKLTI